MEKKNDNLQPSKSNLELQNRKKLSLTGVNEVMSFDEEKIVLNTMLGKLKIVGQNLKMNKLDVKNGDVIIEGYITSMAYSNKSKQKRKRLNFKKFISR